MREEEGFHFFLLPRAPRYVGLSVGYIFYVPYKIILLPLYARLLAASPFAAFLLY